MNFFYYYFETVQPAWSTVIGLSLRTFDLAPTLPAELVHFMVHYIFDACAVGHSGVLLKGFEGFAGAV